MRAGELDQRIKILSPRSIQNGAGETTTFYDVSAEALAQVRQQSAMETIRNGDMTAQAAYAIRMRWRPGITAGCRVLVPALDRTLEISQVIEGHKRRTELQLIAHEVQA